MNLPVKVMLNIDDTIWELWGVDTSPLKNSKPWENWIMVYMPEKRHFSFIKLAGKRKIDPDDLKKFHKTIG